MYWGEISEFGDSVRIIKEPEIDVNAYQRGTSINVQDLQDDDFTMVIDQANYFAFKLDDIEAAHSHVNWMDMASDRAAYRLRDQFDAEVMRYASGYKLDGSGDNVPRSDAADVNGTKQDTNAGNDELLAANKLDRTDFLSTGTAGGSIPLDPTAAAGTVSPLAMLNRMSRILDQANVEKENRFFVADPVFYEMLMDENSKLISNDYAGGQDAGDILRNGRVVSGTIRGFKVFVSNNVVQVGGGAGTAGDSDQATDYGVALAGHMSAIATAQQLAKTEQYRDTNSFADIVRGMQLYGRKILRSESLLTARYNVA